MNDVRTAAESVEGARRLIALCRDCQTRFGAAVKVRTIAVLAEVARKGQEQQWCVAAGLDVLEGTIRHDLMRLGRMDRHGQDGLGMVEEFRHPRTNAVSYRTTDLGRATVEELAVHFGP